MQFSFDKLVKKTTTPEPNQSTNSAASAVSADDRLRKAIERNRAKMAKRGDGETSSFSQGQSTSPSSGKAGVNPDLMARLNAQRQGSQAGPASQASQASQASRFGQTNHNSALTRENINRENQNRDSHMKSSLSEKFAHSSSPKMNDEEASNSLLEKMRQRKEQQASARSFSTNGPASSAEVVSDAPHLKTRRVITDPDKIELNAPLRKTATTAPAVVEYDNKSLTSVSNIKNKISAKRKLKAKTKIETKNALNWFVKGSWLFCLFLIGRLVFAEGGIVEFFQKKNVYNQKMFELEQAKTENDDLMKELESIQNDFKYQKKLVRDHLGYIAKDEYLILFSKSSKQDQENLDASAI